MNPEPPTLRPGTGPSDPLWSLEGAAILDIAPPHIRTRDGHIKLAWARSPELSNTRTLPHGVVERIWRGGVAAHPGVELEWQARTAPDNPVVRFRYLLRTRVPLHLANQAPGRNDLTYATVSLAGFPDVREVRLSTFHEPVHSYLPEEAPLTGADFASGLAPMGPILAAAKADTSLLLAYEHGSQHPHKFLEFQLVPDRTVTLCAVQGNYLDGQAITPETPFETLWFHAAVVPGGLDDLAAAYRDFLLRRQSPNPASRKPWIFYNTWNHQERLKHTQKRAYLAEMNEARMLAEIDAAHRIGIEVFVIDTGWYARTGDWEVDRSRFPRGLGPVKEALDQRGMKLGLWFNPTIAALTSRMHQDHCDCIQEWRGVPHAPHAHWEGEPSQGLCLVSRYAEAYAREMIRLVRETGVTYFKWDAISQRGPYSCDAPGHGHGGPEHSPEERNACYAFEQVRAMCRIIDQVCAACPEAIFDFDITEDGRSVGLAFLASGKYFLVNNGPYFHNYDLPGTLDGNANLYFHPGPARAWICRTPLEYDRWIPSVLFLTHYLPDPPLDSQWINAASLMLGQNGIWGDLLALNEADIATWRRLLDLYKQVREDVTTSVPHRTGRSGGSPEIHEKIAPNGRGLVAVFAQAAGTYDYITRHPHPAEPTTVTPGIEIVGRTLTGHVRVRLHFDRPSAHIIFFGTNSPTHLD